MARPYEHSSGVTRFRQVADSEVMRPPLDGSSGRVGTAEGKSHANVGDFVQEKLHIRVN
jgi:hypothetical protein